MCLLKSKTIFYSTLNHFSWKLLFTLSLSYCLKWNQFFFFVCLTWPSCSQYASCKIRKKMYSDYSILGKLLSQCLTSNSTKLLSETVSSRGSWQSSQPLTIRTCKRNMSLLTCHYNDLRNLGSFKITTFTSWKCWLDTLCSVTFIPFYVMT